MGWFAVNGPDGGGTLDWLVFLSKVMLLAEPFASSENWLAPGKGNLCLARMLFKVSKHHNKLKIKKYVNNTHMYVCMHAHTYSL